MKKVRALAFYLPQFHPIPENDAWWGKGFTEWRKVTAATPRFNEHVQPRLPSELGFYDLRVPEVREAQSELAREHGLDGFIYYHFWFNGRRLLNRPFDEVLASGRPDFPFALCWANENWTRAWNGRESQVLLRQDYNEDDDRRHIRWLAKAFQDERYIRVEGKPLFLVYAAGMLPNARRTTETWREECRALGVGEIFLCRVENFHTERAIPAELGFDAGIEFQPDFSNLGWPLGRSFFSKILNKLGLGSRAHHENFVFDYETIARRMLEKPQAPYRRFPCVMPSWDNSPRREKGAYIFTGASPAAYEKWLAAVHGRASQSAHAEELIFVNAWNEWAEGAVLEPCQDHGRGFLEATRRVLSRAQAPKKDEVLIHA